MRKKAVVRQSQKNASVGEALKQPRIASSPSRRTSLALSKEMLNAKNDQKRQLQTT